MAKSQTQLVLDDDILNPKFSVSCLDFLLIELVPLAQRIAEQLHAREQALIDEFKNSKIFNNRQQTEQQQHEQQQGSTSDAIAGAGASTGVRDSVITGTSSITGAATAATTTAAAAAGIGEVGIMSEEIRESVHWRLDRMGYRVGQGLVERFSANKPRPQAALDAIKFICKDLWILLFRKQIDNLKTNHRGVFVLTDARFQPLSRMSVDRRGGAKAGEEAIRRAQTFLYFPCGIIRGALAGLGLEDVSITAETTEIPAAAFQIKTKGAKT